jgi:hypothetical protein
MASAATPVTISAIAVEPLYEVIDVASRMAYIKNEHALKRKRGSAIAKESSRAL